MLELDISIRAPSKIIEDDSVYFDMLSVGIAIILGIFGFFNYRDGNCFYYFDMKPVYYKELFCAILIPGSFGFVLARGVHCLVRIKHLNKMCELSKLCGRATIPIMFMHMPLNHWQNAIGYGKLIYTIIGVGIPILVVMFCGRYPLMRKLFGLPKLESKNF